MNMYWVYKFKNIQHAPLQMWLPNAQYFTVGGRLQFFACPQTFQKNHLKN